MGKVVKLDTTRPDPEPPDGDRTRISSAFSTVLYLLGTVLIVGASWLTWRRLDDYTVFRVLIPGVVAGLVCIIVASVLLSETRKRTGRGKLK